MAKSITGPGSDFKRNASHCLRLTALCLAAVSWPFAARGADVGLAGVFPGKALLTINGGAPRTVAVGVRTAEGVVVIGIEDNTATVEIDGKRRVLRVGQNVAAQSGGGPARAVLTADAQGHFITTGYINGSSVRFIVDTGASAVSIGAGDARRIGLDPSRGTRGVNSTANGLIEVSRIKLDSVRVGDIVLNNVDASVSSSDIPYVLLGMSFLNRMEMQRSGDTMTLTKRY
ncbi:MAG: TIGR02281 family clan AA aspartic protease [Candidatus Accumulibacter sp.]|nr:TIGR02281 family clan AA aspartic protease [Accumulibacter sp.]